MGHYLSREQPSLAVRTYTASGNSLLAVGMPCAFYSQQPPHPVFETGADDQPIISDLARQTDARLSFNELLDTHIDFSNFIMNWLNVNTLTPDLLAGPTYELIRGSCTSLTELEYHLEEVYKATTDQLDWVNPEGQQCPYNLLQPLLLIPDNRGRRDVHQEHYQQEASGRSSTGSGKLPKEAQHYEARYNKDKKNKLIRIDELHKFSDGTLNDVRNALDDRMKGIRM
nr:hypothetical protein [Tanacetum cinerariifolium]